MEHNFFMTEVAIIEEPVHRFDLQIIGLICKSMDWFLYNMDLRHDRVKCRCVFRALLNIGDGSFD